MRHCVKHVRYYGFKETLVEALPFLREMLTRNEQKQEDFEAFDAQFGTDTAEEVWPWELPSVGKYRRDMHVYQTLAASTINNIIGELPIAHDRFTFIDLGSGKGRALLVASIYPFRKIVGVEVADELHQIALKNIDTYAAANKSQSIQKCQSIVAVRGDATQYEFPQGPLVVFMYSPFGKATLTKVIDGLGRSYDAEPRKIILVYANPQFDSILQCAPFLRRMPSTQSISLYETLDCYKLASP